MNAKSIKTAVDAVGKTMRSNSPTILTGLGVAGLVTTVVLAVKATPKAMKLIEEYDEYLGYKTTSDPMTTIKVAWKPYIPAMVMGTATIACIIGSNSINLRRNAALAGAYSLTETVLKEYQSKVVETIGEKKEQAIKDEIAKDTIKANPVVGKDVINTGFGDTLCFDTLSGRYFYSNMEALRRAQNDINHDLINDVWVSLNEAYAKMGLKGIDLGEETGWNVDKMLEFEFSSHLSETGVPCLVLGYRRLPFPNFRN